MRNCSRRRLILLQQRSLFAVILFFFISNTAIYAQPANDNCASASVVNIGGGGFGLGVFTSSTFDLTSATVQPGETFAPAILVAGQNQKSVWYKFSLPTTRSVRVTLAQPGSLITAGDAGFAVYKTNSCLPTGTEISTKLTPIGIFGNSFHPCVENGEYLVQVSSKAAANGPVYITVETGQPTATYDQQVQAYDMGTLPRGLTTHPGFNVDCQSIEDAGETCTALSNYQDYTKSTWHVFKTPSYLDLFGIFIWGNTGKIGVKIYQGDVRNTPYSSLPLVAGCDSIMANNIVPGSKVFNCTDINPNMTYSIQLFYYKDYQSPITLRLLIGGFGPTIAPEPILSAITPTTNNLGVLPSSPAGITTGRNDYLACNSRHSIHPCSPSLPAGGVSYGGVNYNLSTFFTFTLSGTSNVNFNIGNANPAGACGPPLFARLFNQGLTNNCSDLNTANIIGQFITSSSFSCLPPGNYTLQVMGHNTLVSTDYYCPLSNLGTIIDMNINVKSINAFNAFSLSSAGKFDTLNQVAGVMQPLTPNVTYTSKVDTFGCANTVMPADPNCNPAYTKVMYREFIVPDSGIVSMWSSGSTDLNYKIFKGDANALAIAQNVFSYPGTITGLTPQTLCLNNTAVPPYVCDGTKVCVEPGTYTEAVYASTNQIGHTNQFQVRFNDVNTTHYNLATAEDMGDILSIIPPTGGSVTSSADYYSCKDNAMVIDGFQPCKGGYGSPGTKAIYRQFYLSSPASINIASIPVGCDYTPFTLFSGKATDGIAGLKVMPVPWQCTTGVNGSICNLLPAGWYTIVSYGWGPSYQNPTRNLNDVYYGFAQYSSMVGYGNKIQITLNVSNCPLPKYNRPNKAAIDTNTNQPFLIQWGPRVGSTSAYPRTDTIYNLYTENFLCADTPFAAHPLLPCNADPSFNKVAYYVFQTTQESFLRITSSDYWIGAGTWAFRMSVYAGNVRTTPNLLTTTSPIQPCIMQSMGGQVQLCNVQPGYYTIVIYAHSSVSCQSVTPSIYIDKMGYSRFDHANNAYDFGLIPSDSTWYSGKPGDVNPLDPGRAPSSDIFYCTTGSQPDDPAYGCWSAYLPSIYNPAINNPLFPSNLLGGTFGNTPFHPRRNLWYTFVVDKGGWVRVKVKNKTPGKTNQYPYFVFKSDVNGTLPFSTVVSMGGVDSTAAQGLVGVAENAGSGQTCQGGEEVSFYRQACSPIAERYYIIVQNPTDADFLPNHQVEVSVLFDTVNAIQPKFDHYYQASNIGTNLGPGVYTGATDYHNCATRDATDPLTNVYLPDCNKTLWYKFSTTISGNIKMRMFNSINSAWEVDNSKIELFRQIIAGDSTANGLQWYETSFVNYGGGDYYSQVCITPGTYYIILPNCSLGDGYVYPQITLEENLGDYCSKPMVANLNGAGTSVTSVLVNCHTIGTDYGEFNPTLTCPAGAITNQYKSSWFKINITGTDTLDVTTYLTESTNASSSQIKYRLMNGNCGAMQERSCVQDALTQDTYKCLAPGDYWVQVFTPVTVNGNQTVGTIELHLNAVHHADTCAPINPCLSNANFQMQFDCTQSTAVRFINYSTFGSSVSYQWNFGYAGQTSTAVSPSFVYPSLNISQKYYITLTVTNNSCGGSSTYLDSIIIPARPVINLGNDTSLCDGGSVVLNATSFAGSTYSWNTGATTTTITVSTPGLTTYMVAVTYNGCIARDTIKVNIDPISPQKTNKYLCGIDPVNLNASRGLGESYAWNTGATSAAINVFNTGTYWVDMNLRGCITRDSFIVSATAAPLGNDRSVCFGTQPVVLNATTAGATSYTWQNGSTNATFTAPTAGLYWVDVSFGNCTLRDTVVLSNLQPVLGNLSSAICQGQSYTAPSGKTYAITGIYKDTLRTVQGCDSVINTLNLNVQTIALQTTSANICSGQTYTLPWGTIVNTTGVYRDTLHYTTGCDSVRRMVNLVVQSPLLQNINAGICSGQTYTLPWGAVVSAAGIYKDTLYYVSGCDSVYRTVNLSVATPATQTLNPIICSGLTYTLPWGTVVNTAGVYKDTLHYTGGCDSVYRIVNLTVQSPTSTTINPIICSGQTYTLPWGTIVNTTGVYRDTLHYTTGCDSVRRTVNLVVQSPLSQNINAGICSGQTYTLPWGLVVNAAGIYKDTLHYTSGCDSVYRTVNLSVATPATQTLNPIICSGLTYTLPWGTVVNTAGVYKDTLHYTGGCDSVYRIVNLTVQSPTSMTISPIICSGQTYTLPWGTIVNTTGVYRDTLHYTTGCDSVRRTVNLTVQSPISQNINAGICSGQTYTLPWGLVVNAAGIYKDTLHYTSGCDSVYRIVNLLIQSPQTASAINAIICAGQTYTLPWGAVVNAAGIYKDTLHYTSGCDSLYRTVNLTVQSSSTWISNPAICAGQTYTLPWGAVVNATGIYRDTLQYANTGCDSVRRIVTLTVQNFQSVTTNPVICAGQSYTLPWGQVVTTAGAYRDTLRYSNTGCDSLRRTVNLTIQSSTSTSSNATICTGQTYTLPWGAVVNTSGIYRDTLRYRNTGCDSVRRIVNLTVQSKITVSSNAAICQGQSYTLPWGAVVNTSGVYRDTLRYRITNCDSVYRIVNLTVTPALISNINASICAGDSYTLPWGTNVTSAGVYRDTVRTSIGCDSLVRSVTLTIKPKPVVTISKSNDIDCMIGTSKLNATGGNRYLWQPASTLSNPAISNPIATPTTTTIYKVEVTSANGCIKEDSIIVKVSNGTADNGFLVPSAFTPNGDGKNDCFGVKHWGNVTNLKMQVYNRWGELVFATTDPSQCWDGTYKGEKQATAVFIYQVWADTFCGAVYRNGTVTLIR